MAYVDGFLIPARDKEAYLKAARFAAPIFKEFGALKIVECWGDDVKHGKVTDFYRAVNAEEGENIVFSWIIWPSKQVRDEAGQKMMSDERFANMDMPFDGKRMIVGGFEIILDEEAN